MVRSAGSLAYCTVSRMDATCSINGCDRAASRRGYCQTHYKRVLKTGSPGPPIKPQRRRPAECIIEGCPRDADGPGCGRGYCASHYARWRKTGDPGFGEIRHWDAAPEVCGVWSCEGPPHARGLCSTHHARWLKHGDPGVAGLLRRPSGPCKLPDCEEPRFGYDYCRTHYRHWKRYGDPNVVQYSGFRGDEVGYLGAHCRLREQLGRADARLCVSCGKQAQDWAYIYTDPDVRYDATSGRPFSLDSKCYVPMCRSCHRRMDINVAKQLK